VTLPVRSRHLRCESPLLATGATIVLSGYQTVELSRGSCCRLPPVTCSNRTPASSAACIEYEATPLLRFVEGSKREVVRCLVSTCQLSVEPAVGVLLKRAAAGFVLRLVVVLLSPQPIGPVYVDLEPWRCCWRWNYDGSLFTNCCLLSAGRRCDTASSFVDRETPKQRTTATTSLVPRSRRRPITCHSVSRRGR